MQPVGSSFGYDEVSSQTQESASAQAAKPIPLRPQDKGKFVVRWDVAPLPYNELIKKIDKIAATLKEVANELNSIEHTIQFRKAERNNFGDFSKNLQTIGESLDKQMQKLQGVSGCVKQVATLQDSQIIPAIFCRSQELELHVLLCQKSKRKLEALCESDQFIETYSYVKKVIPSLFAVLTDQTAPIFNGFIDSIDELIKNYVEPINPQLKDLFKDKPNKQKVDSFISEVTNHVAAPPPKQEKTKQHATKRLYLEMLEASLVLAKAVFSEKRQGTNQTTGRLNWRIKILEALTAHAKAHLPKTERHQSSEKPNFDAFRQLSSKDFSFWKYHQKKSYWHTIGYYPQTGAMATAMEENIGQVISGLLQKLRNQLFDYSKGQFHKALEQEIKDSWSCLQTLEETFTRYFEQSCRTPFDELTQNVLDYAHGIRYAFGQTRSLLKLAAKCSSGPARTIFGAVHSLQTHYEKQDYTSDLEQTLGLAATIVATKEAEKNRPRSGHGSLRPLLCNTLDVLNEIHAQKNPQLFSLTEHEAIAPQWILAKNPINALYEHDEARGQLPLVVMNYISKRIMSFLYLPSDTHDIELELLLEILKNEKPPLGQISLYMQSIKAHPAFETLITTYETAYMPFRLSDEQLLCGLAIARSTLQSQDHRGNALEHARAWQLLFEFTRKHKGQKADALEKALVGYLNIAASEKKYVPIYSTVARRDNETWPVDANNPEEFLSHIQQAYEECRVQVPNLTEQQLFDSVLLRLLCSSCFALDKEEQVTSHKQLISLFMALSESDFLLNIPEDLKQLVCESACDKILGCNFENDGGENVAITHVELKLLLDGPIEDFFSGARWKNDKIEMVIFKLIQAEFFTRSDKPLKNKFIKEKGELAFHRWFDNFERMLEQNPIAKLSSQEIQSE